jgi:protein TonB
MFEDFVEGAVAETGRKKWAVVFSVVIETLTLAILLLTPLIYTQAIPKALLNMRFLPLPAAMPLVEAPKSIRVVSAHSVKPIERFIRNGVIYQPRSFPAQPLSIVEPEIPPESLLNDSDRREGFNLLRELSDKPAEVFQPVAPPELPKRVYQSHMEPAMILAQPQPAYPALARMARIQGQVTLHAIIDRAGRVAELQVISGHPLLVEAALMAVRNWRYRPTMLNGSAVEVETTITVNFVLGG